MPAVMHLLEEDVLRLLSLLPHLTLAKQRSAKIYVTALVRDCDELQPILAQYPAVRYEPLEQHYALLRCLGSMSEEFISDLCNHYAWRGVVAAALLVALSPDARYRPYLADAYDCTPHNQWLIDLALAEIGQVDWPDDPEFQSTLRQLRARLHELPHPAASLRKASGLEQQADVVRESVKSAYYAGGLRSARTELEKIRNGMVDSEQPATCQVHGDTLIGGTVEIAYGTWLPEPPDVVAHKASTYPHANLFVQGTCWVQEKTHARVRYCPSCRSAWSESPEARAAERERAEQAMQEELARQWAITLAGRARRRQVTCCAIAGAGLGALTFYFSDTELTRNVFVGGLIGSILGWALNRLQRKRKAIGRH